MAQAGDEFQAFVFEGLEVDFAAHAAVKNEHGVWDLKAAAKDFDSVSQRGGVGAVASQDGFSQLKRAIRPDARQKGDRCFF